MGFLDVGSPAECLLHGIMFLAVPEIANDVCLVVGCHLHRTVGGHDLVATGIQFVMVGI